ncbi:MAG TPA: orotidine-5'-phosphate decarboxylase [Solirubrobacteraceae bacterium]
MPGPGHSRMDAGRAPSGANPALVGNSEIREPSETFADRLAELVGRRQSQLVLGLDPDPARLWPGAICPPAGEADSAESASPAVRAAAAVTRHCTEVIRATAPECVAVKLQIACFERLGAPGWAALHEVADAARRAGLLVIADAKRGDIDVSAAAYAQAFLGETPTPFGPVAGLGADALTVNPLLGRDSLAPFVDAAARRGAGLFVLARTSNPGAADVQELKLADGETVSDRLARLIAELGAERVGRSGLSDVGAVVGATAPQRLIRLRELMPRAVILLPGVGAQGGKIEHLAPVFAPGPAAGLVSASRAVVAAHEREGGDPAQSARREAARLRELAWRVAR